MLTSGRESPPVGSTTKNEIDPGGGEGAGGGLPPRSSHNSSMLSSSSSGSSTLDFDDLLTNILGQFGHYQKAFVLFACFVSLLGAFNNLSIVFVAAEPSFQCVEPSAGHLNISLEVLRNLTTPPGGTQEEHCSRQCHRYDTNYSEWTVEGVEEALQVGRGPSVKSVKCQYGWTYNRSTYQSTIVTEWDLVCDRQELIPTAASIYMAGMLVGVSVYGAISDWFGRKAALVPSTFGMVIFSIASSFSPNYATFAALRFMLAFNAVGCFTTGFVMGMELVGPAWRVFVGIVVDYFWVAGYLIVGGLAYGFRDWQSLSLACAIPQVVLILLVIFVPESPRWLYSRNKHQRGDAVVKKMAKWNKVALPPGVSVQIQKGPQAYVFHLFKYPRLRWRTLNICFNWFVNSLVYYGLSFNTGQLGGDDYLNFILSGLVEVPAYVFCQIGLRYLGRRKSLVGTMVAGGVALLLIRAVPSSEQVCGVPDNAALHNVRVTLALIGKLCISASFAITYVFSAELFPTVVRNVGVGLGSTCARIGGIIAPYILEVRSDVAYIIFGVMAVTSGLSALMLPETKDQQLPETIEDGENFPSKELKLVQQDQPEAGTTHSTEADVRDMQPETAYLSRGTSNVGVNNPACSFDSNI